MNNTVEYKKYFEGKKITKQGFGFLGRGANVVKFLLENGAEVIVTDTKNDLELAESIREVDKFIADNNISKDKITYVLGQHRMQDFENINIVDGKYISGCDYVLQASGVPKDNIYLGHARNNSVKVYQESSLFVEIVREFNENIKIELELKPDNSERLDNIDKNKIKIIGTTGTRGKTTVTFLIKKIIDNYIEKGNLNNKNNNLDKNRKAYFGGNVQGVASLENLKYIKSGDVIVMELDSWILQGFKDVRYSPDVAVFTNLMSDHMNYYKNDMQDYFYDKANIFLYKNQNDILVTTQDVKDNIFKKYLSEQELENITGENNLFKNNYFLSMQEIKSYNTNYKSLLLGEHNKINLALAIKACEEFIKKENRISEKESEEIMQESLNTFTGVAGRLELIKEANGVKYYNDSCSTTPDAAIAALTSLAPTTHNSTQIILITGGRDKEIDMTMYAEKIIQLKQENKIKKIILLSDETTTGTQKLKKLFVDNSIQSNFDHYIECKNLSEAIHTALSAVSQEKAIILFSPAFASFGMFLNEYDRGDKFNEVVNSL